MVEESYMCNNPEHKIEFKKIEAMIDGVGANIATMNTSVAVMNAKIDTMMIAQGDHEARIRSSEKAVDKVTTRLDTHGSWLKVIGTALVACVGGVILAIIEKVIKV